MKMYYQGLQLIFTITWKSTHLCALPAFPKEYVDIMIDIDIQVMIMQKVDGWRLFLMNPKKVSVSTFFKYDVKRKKGHTQWQICITGRGWWGLTNPSKLIGSFAPVNWVSELPWWMLKGLGGRTKTTVAGQGQQDQAWHHLGTEFIRNTGWTGCPVMECIMIWGADGMLMSTGMGTWVHCKNSCGWWLGDSPGNCDGCTLLQCFIVVV